MISMIVYLPEDIVKFVLSEWLSWKDLGRLDVASGSNRQLVLNMLKSLQLSYPVFPIRSMLDGNILKQFHHWVYSRNILLIEMNFHYGLPSEVLDSIPCDHVFTLKGMSRLDITGFANKCVNLQSLYLRSLKIDIDRVDGKILHRLKLIDIGKLISRKSAEAIVEHCHQLTSLNVKSVGEYAASTWAKLIQSNPRLQFIETVAFEPILSAIGLYCSDSIRSLVLSGSECNFSLLAGLKHLNTLTYEEEVKYTAKDNTLVCNMYESKKYEGWNAFVASLTPLLVYRVQMSGSISNVDSIAVFTHHGQSLKRLEVTNYSFDSNFNAAYFRNIFEMCPGLEELKFDVTTAASFSEAFSLSNNRLRKLELSGCNNSHDLIHVLELCKFLEIIIFTVGGFLEQLAHPLGESVKLWVYALRSYHNQQSTPLNATIKWPNCYEPRTLRYDGHEFTGEVWDEFNHDGVTLL